jgi:hypothetical protein
MGISWCRRFRHSASNTIHETDAEGQQPPTYLHALVKQRGAPDLPYTMEVWYLDKKIVNVQWDDDDKIQLISFHPGAWEEKLATISKAE